MLDSLSQSDLYQTHIDHSFVKLFLALIEESKSTQLKQAPPLLAMS
jgi:hypothetical protein